MVRRGGLAVPILAAKQRVVLAALLLHANRVVELDYLAEAVWGGAPPTSARVTLQNYVRRLRVALGDAGHSRLATFPHGYQINVDDSELDISQFEALQGEARVAARCGAWDQAAAQLRTALGLWRGKPLSDVPSELLLVREKSRLQEMHMQAIEACLDADLYLGRHTEVVAELQQLTADHPLRERLHGMLMLALYRDGRQGEALAAYRLARQMLVSELGVEPGPNLRDLHQRILTADRGLAGPASLQGKRGAEAVVPRQLPAAVSHFAGRRKELRKLSDLLDEAAADMGTVVISAIGGTAGVGKTALAVYWARQVADHFPAGQLYVNLRGFDPTGTPLDPSHAVRGFLGALGIPAERIPADLDAQAALYRSVLVGKRMLIVLDNAADATQARPLLPGSPGCLVVVTSRSRLGGLVATDGAHPITLDVLTDAEAADLLAHRLGTERLAREPAAVAELIGLCARLPLALAITAARAAANPDFPFAALAAELRDASTRLDALDAGEPPTDVRAVFSWSCRHLDQPAARMFRLLGVHLGPDITAPAAASLAALPVTAAHRALSELAAASLLTEHTPGRYAFHDLLRAYATEQAHATDSDADRRAAIHRALDHYLHTAHVARLLLNPQREPLRMTVPQPGAVPEHLADYDDALAWFDAERRVLFGAVAHAASADFNAHAWQIAWALEDFFERRGHWHDYAATQRTALAAAERLHDQAGKAHASRNLGRACTLLGAYDEAEAHFSRGLDLYRRLGDRIGQARTHFGFAHVFWHRGHHGEALRHAMQALDLYQAAGHRAGQAHALNNIGYFHACLRDYRLAVTRCQQALALHRDLGNRTGQASTWDSLGYAHHHLGEHAEAIACFKQSLAVLSELGDCCCQADVLSHLGDAYHAVRDPQAARDAWRQALEILDELHHPDAEQVRAKLRDLAKGR